MQRVDVLVEGRPLRAHVLELVDGPGDVELASFCGLSVLEKGNPQQAAYEDSAEARYNRWSCRVSSPERH